jgi:Transglutaminase-like superfamily
MKAIVRRGARVAGQSRPARSWRRRLTAADWRLLAAVALAQVAAAAALRARPLLAVRATAGRLRRLAPFFVRGSDERIAWAIEATGRRLGPLSTCLVRALVAEFVLDSNAGPLSLTIGVRRTAAGTLAAHAWLARQDRVLVGATADAYLPLVNWTSPQ